MIIDTHVHCGFFYFPIRQLDADGMLAVMDRFGIDISIISNIDGLFYDFNDCNDAIKLMLAKAPDRLKGYVVCNPNYLEKSLAEIKKYARHPDFVGVKLHASWHNRPIDGSEFAPIFELCEELMLPVLIHSYVVDDTGDQNSCPERIANVARRHKNPLITAHMGGNARRCFKALRNFEHVSVDISSGRERASQLYVWRCGRVDEAVIEMGAKRVIFGSDFPLLDVSICMGMMEDARLDDKTRDLIMSGNAQRIFGL